MPTKPCGRVEAKVQSALDGVGIFAAVLTPVINHMGSDAGGAIMGELSELVVSVAESPTNRARPGACTALDAACRAAALIHSEVITFGALRQSLDESNGLVICNVTFATTIQVALINHED